MLIFHVVTWSRDASHGVHMMPNDSEDQSASVPGSGKMISDKLICEWGGSIRYEKKGAEER
jgi:hypothetical protein